MDSQSSEISPSPIDFALKNLQNGYQIYRKDPVSLSLLFFLSALASVCTFGVLAGVCFVNYFRCIKRVAAPNYSKDDETSKIKVGDLLSDFSIFVPSVILGILLFACAIIPILIITKIIPALTFLISLVGIAVYLVGALAFLHLAFGKSTSPIDCFMLAVDDIKKRPVELLVFFGASFAINLVTTVINISLLSFIAGLIVSPWLAASLYSIYLQMHPQPTEH